MAFESVLFEASSAKTSTGNSNPQGSTLGNRVVIAVDVTAVSGTTPSMTLSVQWSHDGTTWIDADVADAFVAITAAKKTVKDFVMKAPIWRLVWTISGTTPSFTFSARSYTVG